MHDVIFKAVTSEDHMNRRLFFKESTEESGISIKMEKNWGYTIKNISPYYLIGDMNKWMEMYAGNKNCQPTRDVSIRRTHNTKTGEDKFEYEITGNLFIIHQHRIFVIGLTYYFSVDSVMLSVKK